MTTEIPSAARTSGPFSNAFLAAAALVGKRWTGAIVYALAHDYHRFSELESVVPGLSGRMLSQRLKELEAAEVVRRDVIADTPVRVEYWLTDKGEDLRGVFVALNGWSHRWSGTTTPDGPPLVAVVTSSSHRRSRS